MTSLLIRHFSSGIKRFSSGILLSRLSGFGRDLAMAYAFGDQPAVASFMIAFRFSHLLRRFFGEGSLQSVFIPHFEELRIQGEAQAILFFQRLKVWLMLMLLVLILIIKGGITCCLSYFSFSDSISEILKLTNSLLFSLFFISLYGLNLAFLQCYHLFFLPNIAPIFCNLAWIIGALTLKHEPIHKAMFCLVKWIVFGFFLQYFLTCLPLIKIGSFRIKKIFILRKDKMLKKPFKAFALGGLGVGATQINSFFDALFASLAHPCGPIYLWYAIRFYQLLLALFGMAIVSTMTPLLSRVIKQENASEKLKIFNFGFKQIVTIMLLCTFFVFAFGHLIINYTLGGSLVSLYGKEQISRCFLAYSLSLTPATLTFFFSSICYAEDDFKTPVRFAFLTVIFNIILNSFFIFVCNLGSLSTALATSLGSLFNGYLLYRFLKQKGWKHAYSFQKFIVVFLGGFLAFCVVFSMDLFFVKQEIFSSFSPFIMNSIRLSLEGLSFLGTLAFFSKISNNYDIKTAFRLLLGK